MYSTFLFNFFCFFVILADRGDSYSSYDSLDKYNYALETLKITDNNYFNGNMLQPKCRQPYVHSGEKLATNANNDETKQTSNLPPRPPLPKTSTSLTTIDKDLVKYNQLSDWYYIKTGPKSPLPPRASDKRNGIYQRLNEVDVTTKPFSNNNEKIYVKTSSSSSGNLSQESTKNNFNIYSECIAQRRPENSNIQYNGSKSDVKIIIDEKQKMNKNVIKDGIEDNCYQEIGIPSNHRDVHAKSVAVHHQQSNHQYSVNEPLCKFNSNNEKVKGFSKWQQQQPHQKPQEHQYSEKQRLLLLSPPSPSLSQQKMQKLQKHASHPYYYVESLQKPIEKQLSSPRQERQIKLSEKQNHEFHQQKLHDSTNRLHCIQQQQISNSSNASKSQIHNEHLNSFGGSSIAVVNSTVAMQQQHNEMNSNSFERVNVTSGFPSLSNPMEMTIEKEKHQFNNKHYASNEHSLRAMGKNVNENKQCLQQTNSSTISSSPSMPISTQSKVCFMLLTNLKSRTKKVFLRLFFPFC